jgi:hypothetical protein
MVTYFFNIYKIRELVFIRLVVIGKNVPGYLVNPRLKPGTFPVTVPVLNDPQKHVLGQVFSQCPVQRHPRQKIENALVVPLKEQGSLLKFTVFYGLHDHFVSHQVSAFFQFSC